MRFAFCEGLEIQLSWDIILELGPEHEARWDGSKSLIGIDFHVREVLHPFWIIPFSTVSIASSQLDDDACPLQAGSPDWVLLYWQWEKSKVMASVKSNGMTNNTVHQVSETSKL